MSTAKTLQISTSSLEDTFILGEKIASNLKGGEVIELISDIGGGKTALVRGMARGLKSKDDVASPTFTISRTYRSSINDIEIAHYDFYRLDDPGIMSTEIAESIMDEKTVVVIEWAGIVKGVLPTSRLSISIEVGEKDIDRLFRISANKEQEYLLENLG